MFSKPNAMLRFLCYPCLYPLEIYIPMHFVDVSFGDCVDARRFCVVFFLLLNVIMHMKSEKLRSPSPGIKPTNLEKARVNY